METRNEKKRNSITKKAEKGYEKKIKITGRKKAKLNYVQ